jgi:hypothetical protein
MKEKLFTRAIEWARKKGFEKIKANQSDFEPPKALSRHGKDSQVIPDMTGLLRGNKSYMEIADKSQNLTALATKWKLFCELASRKGGTLYLLAAKGHKSFAKEMVKKYNLYNAKVISI